MIEYLLPFRCLAAWSIGAVLMCSEGGFPVYPVDLPPSRFEEDIEIFEKQDRTSPPPEGGIVFLGSSSIVDWHGSIRDDLAPLTVIPRGFGGSTMYDAYSYLDRIVLPYGPRAVVIYEGDNDIASGVAPQDVRDGFKKVVEYIHAELPETRIYYLSIKPSISRWELWPSMVEANTLIAAECADHDLLTFVDVATPMLDAEGRPRRSLFQADMLHMSREGYRVWRDAVRPVLFERELEYERTAEPLDESE